MIDPPEAQPLGFQSPLAESIQNLPDGYAPEWFGGRGAVSAKPRKVPDEQLPFGELKKQPTGYESNPPTEKREKRPTTSVITYQTDIPIPGRSKRKPGKNETPPPTYWQG